MNKNTDDAERIINSFTKRKPSQYENVGLVAKYIYQQFDQPNEPKIFSYEEIFKALNLNDYYQNEFDFSFFFAASIFLFNQLGLKIFPNEIKNKILVVKTI